MGCLKWVFFCFPLFCLAQNSFEKGQTLFKACQYAAAELYFDSTVRITPNDVSALEYLDDSKCRQQKWEAAVGSDKKLVDSYRNKMSQPENAKKLWLAYNEKIKS